ncbi:MAG: hypothetical protein ACLFVS_03225 [Candidatus Acetothermia bacterium]
MDFGGFLGASERHCLQPQEPERSRRMAGGSVGGGCGAVGWWGIGVGGLGGEAGAILGLSEGLRCCYLWD